MKNPFIESPLDIWTPTRGHIADYKSTVTKKKRTHKHTYKLHNKIIKNVLSFLPAHSLRHISCPKKKGSHIQTKTKNRELKKKKKTGGTHE